MKKYINFSDCAINLAPACQITDSHCGPAVIQTFLRFYGIEVTQDQVVEATRTKSTVIKHGLRPSHLAKAVEKLAPGYQFWFKQYGSVKNLETLIHQYHLPVGVNWQGLFYDTVAIEKKEKPNEDNGHYSVVIDIDSKNDQIIIADPYSEYCQSPRIFSFSWFKTRWWDFDEIKENFNSQPVRLHTYRLLFLVLPKDSNLPQELNLKPSNCLSSLLCDVSVV